MTNSLSRKNIPFTNEHLVSVLLRLQQLGSPYWYGTCMYRCKDSTLTSKAKQYPTHYASSRMDKYRADVAAKRIASDCIGAIKGYCWTNGGEGLIEAFGNDKSFSSKYGSNNCPDKSANGMFSWAKAQGMDWGAISSIPELPGVLVRYDGHVGVYVGGGKVVEWRGFKYGSQVTKLSGRGWTHWYKHPAINYGEVIAETKPEEITLGARLLKRGITGTDVEMLQGLLKQLGYELEIDGAFGPETEKVVVDFQIAEGLEPDGKYGELSHTALMDAIADKDADQNASIATPAVPDYALTVEIAVDVSSVNIRTGNGTQYNRITTARPGARYNYVATATNGWHAIELDGRVGWVSGKYSRVL